MNGKFTVVNPKSIQLTLTVTLPLGDWKDIAEQMSSKYPSWKFAELINKMVRDASKDFEAEFKDVEA